MDFPIIEITDTSPEYPELLKQIADPPRQLYCRGDLSLLNTLCFAVVGTRRITAYGRDAVRHIVPTLARYFTIVSGMALGVDAAAHEASLNANAKTIAVLGSGIDDAHIYPTNNFSLAQKILTKGGLIIAEEKPGTKAQDFMFPKRNRIVSGLSKGVLIVEADLASGSLITASCAAEQNRDVFTVPGDIFSSRTKGPHALIKKGATLVESAQDILDEYTLLELPKRSPLSTQNPTEAVILAILKEQGSLSIDTIIETSGRDASEILATLSLMEINGTVIQTTNGTFRIT